MRQLMEYNIVSGRVVETMRSYLPARSTSRPRGTRKAGASSIKKIKANERQEQLRLARLLNTNFHKGYLLTLKYSDVRLPADYEAARLDGEKIMRKLRLLCKKSGHKLKRILVTANWSPHRNAPARYHHHVVINDVPLSILQELWPEGELHIKRLRAGDLTDLAAYLCDNVHQTDGERWKKWSPSRNLDKPIYTEPVPVSDPAGIQLIAGATEIVQTPTYDEDGRQVGAYMRCTMPSAPKIRGSMIIIPKIKRGGRKRE